MLQGVAISRHHGRALNHRYSALLLKPNLHRLRAALCLTVINRFDIITIRVEHKGGVIAGMIDPLAGGAVVLAAMGERRLIEAIHHGPVLCLKGEVVATGQCPSAAGLSMAVTNSSSAQK